ncbi:collagen alpha-2(I) chain-like [Mustela lutreola]|uniref:collagen alpha-2(I) chain-like n=1 Tax=Mustela lutreola TaxID=9666 RepID=UPI002797145F|nr:collagen alpha-2(I) chain-like [Mustela lutreola]
MPARTGQKVFIKEKQHNSVFVPGGTVSAPSRSRSAARADRGGAPVRASTTASVHRAPCVSPPGVLSRSCRRVRGRVVLRSGPVALVGARGRWGHLPTSSSSAITDLRRPPGEEALQAVLPKAEDGPSLGPSLGPPVLPTEAWAQRGSGGRGLPGAAGWVSVNTGRRTGGATRAGWPALRMRRHRTKKGGTGGRESLPPTPGICAQRSKAAPCTVQSLETPVGPPGVATWKVSSQGLRVPASGPRHLLPPSSPPRNPKTTQLGIESGTGCPAPTERRLPVTRCRDLPGVQGPPRCGSLLWHWLGAPRTSSQRF